MKIITRTALTMTLAAGLTLGVYQPSAEAHSFSKRSHVHAFTQNGYDTVFVQAFPGHINGATCYGHTDEYRSRPDNQPWRDWHYDHVTHCIQV